MTARIETVESTDLFVGTRSQPLQVIRVTVARDGGAHALTITGRGISGGAEVPPGTGETVVEVGCVFDTDAPDNDVSVTLADADGTELARTETVVARHEPGWTMHLVSHFHYDPVWWNTQAAYTSPWEFLAGDGSTRPLWANNGFALVEAHMDLALRDPLYKFVLAEIDYLKPFFDTHPERRADLAHLLGTGQAELLGGTYNEPNTNLTGLETTIRNIVYGVGYQRGILDGDPRTAWQLDVFGHDPQFPGLLAAAGLTGSAWARGPFHQWGPMLKNYDDSPGDATVMQFDSEFEWISPSGKGVLTHYMPNHYGAGWRMDSASTLEDAEKQTYELYQGLKPVAATRNILLPVGTDYTPPNKWVTAIQRDWNERYVWPNFVCATPRDFLDAVREELTERGASPSPQSRDMNPVYTGKDVSYIDTKQAQRAAEVAALDAERLAVFAGILDGHGYPHAALDKVWRQLAYGAHHDAITGSESDQVYIDLLTGWREAHDLAAGARDAALDALAAQISAEGVVVTNTLSFKRDGLVRVALPEGTDTAGVVDDAGKPVASTISGGEVVFRATDVPSLGWRTYRLTPGEGDGGWTAVEGTSIENEHWTVGADPGRGGGLSTVVDKVAKRELLRDNALGNELRVYEEYPTHPQFGEGPWHLLPSGPVRSSAESSAEVRREESALGQRLVIRGSVGEVEYEQTVTLLNGAERIDCRTRVLDFTGADRLLRVKFAADVPGALPVSEVSAGAIGRGFALPDVDVAEAPWTLDNPANNWFGLSSTARVVLSGADGIAERAVGVAEIVTAEGIDVRDLVVALARIGVTATTSRADGPRYGWLHIDSNLPDFRIVVGGPDVNPVAAEILDGAGAEVRAAYTGAPVWIPADRPLTEVWRPNADLRDVRALPALIVDSPEGLVDVDQARITASVHGSVPTEGTLDDYTVALLTYGVPGFAVDATGALHASLLRSCTGWPSGVWIDPPRRTAPDGTAFQLQHWTHEFDYAVVAGAGDWRENRLPSKGLEFSTPLHARHADGSGTLPGTHSLLSVTPERDVLLTTLKSAGNPIAEGATPVDGPVALRLHDATGLGSRATVAFAGQDVPLWTADLLEHRGERVEGGLIELSGGEIATFVAEPARSAEAGPILGADGEVAEPVYARYWLHNRGPAPLGYQPVGIAISPNLVTVEPGQDLELEVRVSSQRTDAEVAGQVHVISPWRDDDLDLYDLQPRGHVVQTLSMQVPDDLADGVYFIQARTHDGRHTIEDTLTVVCGPSDVLPVGDPDKDWGDSAKGTEAGTGRATGLIAGLATEALVLEAGASAAVVARLENGTETDISAELQLASPWGTWELFPEAIKGATIEAGSTVDVEFPVRVPRSTPPGHYWAMVKVMWFGRVSYLPTLRVEVR
ncbi:glycoside hydrolase family 38 C-terminal domain-containing protein [Phytomonospora endophytica]|uniref:Alpha-mannosidase n=1 Tax=Phytomonospora endophytica TaxID=714109 RepID=A0A841FVG6_9ACTN|nr:glycoside hydrolase family 38 C-terminal domain-containing protein [Phytomonospora endophytica]MBB6037522.1 alpha-mannosidase [Phytomonospora endophytica]GIG70774.1 alpha-mannosidase [Phytomonospora endophytica]